MSVAVVLCLAVVDVFPVSVLSLHLVDVSELATDVKMTETYYGCYYKVHADNSNV